MKGKTLLLLTLPLLLSCGESGPRPAGESSEPTWYSEAELSEIGLSGLAAPKEGGRASFYSADFMWHSFYQVDGTLEDLEPFANTFMSYLKDHYAAIAWGQKDIVANTMDEPMIFIEEIKAISTLSEAYDDNPSPKYTFAYLLSDELEGSYYKRENVCLADIRYESESLKLIITHPKKNVEKFRPRSK